VQIFGNTTGRRSLSPGQGAPGAPLETVIGIAEIAPVLIGQESCQIAPEAIHDAKSGASGAKVLAGYTVRKGKPLATPAK